MSSVQQLFREKLSAMLERYRTFFGNEALFELIDQQNALAFAITYLENARAFIATDDYDMIRDMVLTAVRLRASDYYDDAKVMADKLDADPREQQVFMKYLRFFLQCVAELKRE